MNWTCPTCKIQIAVVEEKPVVRDQAWTKHDYWNEIAGSLCCSNMGRGINLRGKIPIPRFMTEEPPVDQHRPITLAARQIAFYALVVWLCGVAGGWIVCSAMHP